MKAYMRLKTGEEMYFDTIPELMEYICDNELIARGCTSKNLTKLYNHATEKFAIDSEKIELIILCDVYSAEVCHHQLYTFHEKTEFEAFMVSMGATAGHIMTGARYGIYGGEIVTKRYDCYITGMKPDYKEWNIVNEY